MKWEDLVDPFTGSKSRRFDWVDEQGRKRAHLITEDDVLFNVPPEEVGTQLEQWHSLF